MTDAELGELMADCPTLFHMAETGAWPSIRRHGLLSTSGLLDLYGVEGAAREAMEARRRPAGSWLERGDLGRALVRDQSPMDDSGLRACLRDGLTPEDWYRLLNGRVFLWLSRARLLRLIEARAYRGRAHEVIELSTASLVAAHRARIALSPINSGTTKPYPQPRGRSTFLRIEEYPYAQWRAKRAHGERVVELTVEGGVPDVQSHALRVVRMQAGRADEIVWSRDA